MLTHGEDVEAHALRSRGWTISAIARHLGRDRKTVRGYINGDRVPGVRARSAPDPLDPVKRYLAARFVDDRSPVRRGAGIERVRSNPRCASHRAAGGAP